MLKTTQIIGVLKLEPHQWGTGYRDMMARHQYYLAAADRIQLLEQQLDRAKTAALIDVARAAGAQGEWAVAQQVLSYVHRRDTNDVPTLPVDSIIESKS